MSAHAQQLTLALTRRADPPTSRAAAALVSTTDLEALVLAILREHQAGLTSHEVAALLNRELVSISPRMRPLCDKGCVRETGRRDGRTVWEATP